VPFTVNDRDADGEPVGAVKFPKLGTEVQVLGGMMILKLRVWTVLFPALFLARTPKLKFPPVVAIPDIIPLVAFSVIPVGNVPVILKERRGGFVAVI
jgi:hypothetical protein